MHTGTHEGLLGHFFTTQAAREHAKAACQSRVARKLASRHRAVTAKRRSAMAEANAAELRASIEA